VLLEIYPAREEPIPGVNSKMLFDIIDLNKKEICSLNELTDRLAKKEIQVLLTMGAGNINDKIEDIIKLLEQS